MKQCKDTSRAEENEDERNNVLQILILLYVKKKKNVSKGRCVSWLTVSEGQWTGHFRGSVNLERLFQRPGLSCSIESAQQPQYWDASNKIVTGVSTEHQSQTSNQCKTFALKEFN
jgi:hypothetical protein